MKPRATRSSARHATGSLLAASAICLAFSAANLSAQGHLVRTGGLSTPGAATVSPHSAAPGASFKLASEGLPPNTQVQIMMGALQSGFEVVKTLMTDERGRIEGADSVSLTVPAWVKNDRPYVVMVTDVYYNPLAAADMLHPTDNANVVKRTGAITLEDPTCPMLTGQAGEIYFLVGDPALLRAAERVAVEGVIVSNSRCGGATTIQVKSVKKP